MTEVRIDRLSATATGWPVPEQVPQMLGHVAADRLENALRENPLPDGEWCVRRLDVAVQLDPERPLSALETDWADRIVTTLRLSLRDGSQDVVLYVRPEAAVDDLLAGLATGRFEHDWAWRQVGLLEAGHPEPQADPAAVCLLVLGRLQHGRVAALARLVGGVGVHAVHRLLGSAGWVRAATLVAAESGTNWAPAEEPAPLATDADDPAAADRRTLHALSQAIVTTGGLAVALRGSALRVDPRTLQAWAVLSIGAAGPSLLRSGPQRLTHLVAAVGDRLQPTAGPGLATAPAARRTPSTPTGPHRTGRGPASDERRPSAEEPRTPDRQGTHHHRRTDADPSDSRARRPAFEPEPQSTEPPAESRPEGATSSWGGLLYLLNSAADAGLPDLFDQPPFLARPAAWVMHRLGLALVPVEPDDPALLAFAGVPTGGPQRPPADAEQRAIDDCVGRWTAATAKRLRAADTDEPTDSELVRSITRRTATIEQEPGWVEVRLRLDEVDLDVRRAGLDVDPGWVWWLGHVVRFRYE